MFASELETNINLILYNMKNLAKQYENGTLTKLNFEKVMHRIDFENYLYKYCKIVNDFRNEYLGDFYRITNFSAFNYHIIVMMKNGECEKIEYTKTGK